MDIVSLICVVVSASCAVGSFLALREAKRLNKETTKAAALADDCIKQTKMLIRTAKWRIKPLKVGPIIERQLDWKGEDNGNGK